MDVKILHEIQDCVCTTRVSLRHFKIHVHTFSAPLYRTQSVIVTSMLCGSTDTYIVIELSQ